MVAVGGRTTLASAHRTHARTGARRVLRRVRAARMRAGPGARRDASQTEIEALPSEAEWPELFALCVPAVARDSA